MSNIPSPPLGVTNTIDPEVFQQLLAKDKKSTSKSNAPSASSWLRNSKKGGAFIAMPLSMIGLRKSSLSLNDLIVLSYIFGFQRSNRTESCYARPGTIATTLGLSPNVLSNRFKKIDSQNLLVRSGHGSEKTFRVDEFKWASLCGVALSSDDTDSLRAWTSKGNFCRIPTWAARSNRLTALDKVLLGRIFSFWFRKEPKPFCMSVQNVASELGASKTQVKQSLAKLVDLGLVHKTTKGERVPAEYRPDEKGCYKFANE